VLPNPTPPGIEFGRHSFLRLALTRELQSPAADTVALRTRPGVVTMADLVRSTLRLRPDRIIVGEVRGPEALDMLKAWNTGHPGGIATVHANSAMSALYRIEGLVQEAVVTVPRRLIAEATDIIVFISGRGLQRRIASIARVAGLDPDTGTYALADLLNPAKPQGEWVIDPTATTYLGRFFAEAANERGYLVDVELIHARTAKTFDLSAEIEEAVWLELSKSQSLELAPLTEQYVLTLARSL
jgi:hypothetical protein